MTTSGKSFAKPRVTGNGFFFFISILFQEKEIEGLARVEVQFFLSNWNPFFGIFDSSWGILLWQGRVFFH